MSVFAICVPRESPFRFDLGLFDQQLQARWPGTPILRSRQTSIVAGYQLPCQPLDAVLDPTAPGGILWYPLLRAVEDAAAPHGRRYLPHLATHPVLYSLPPDRRRLRLDGAGHVDCAMTARWLRRWIPSEVPLVASQQQEFVPVEVPHDATFTEMVRRLLEQNAPLRGGYPKRDYSLFPIGILPDETVARLLQQVLDEDAWTSA